MHRDHLPAFRTLAWVVGIPLLLLCVAGSAGADTGVLKLKVMRCSGSGWLSGARIDVSVTRSGQGVIDSTTGYTNSSGYVDFTFTNLESGDESHVTVTPSGENPDSSHVYVWEFSQGYGGVGWDVGDTTDADCSDYWYDERNDILLCLYH